MFVCLRVCMNMVDEGFAHACMCCMYVYIGMYICIYMGVLYVDKKIYIYMFKVRRHTK